MPIDITDVTRRVQYAGSGTGPYNFTFNIIEDTDVAVYQDDTALALSTDYSVTINPDGTGYVTTVASMTGSTVTIIGARPYQRLTDFVTGGDFTADAVNDELDSIHILLQQLLEETDRSLTTVAVMDSQRRTPVAVVQPAPRLERGRHRPRKQGAGRSVAVHSSSGPCCGMPS